MFILLKSNFFPKKKKKKKYNPQKTIGIFKGFKFSSTLLKNKNITNIKLLKI